MRSTQRSRARGAARLEGSAEVRSSSSSKVIVAVEYMFLMTEEKAVHVLVNVLFSIACL